MNPGDVQILEILVRILSNHMGENAKGSDNVYCSIFLDLMQGRAVSQMELIQQLNYRDWKEDDTYGILVIRHETEEMVGDILRLTANLVCRQVPQCEVIVTEDSVAVLYNECKIGQERLFKILTPLFECDNLIGGIALPSCKIHNLYYSYRQADFALQYPEVGKWFHNFYDHAIDYIIRSGEPGEIIHACHPDIWELNQKDLVQGTERIHTLQVYLNHERSLVNTAQKLFVHRNTLVYRLKKLEEEIHHDMNEVYTRDYMKVSIRILNLFHPKP